MAGTSGEPPDESCDEPPGATDPSDQFATLELLGGRLCLDFVNSVDPRVVDHQRDYLASYGDLVRWSEHARVLSPDRTATLLRAAARHPDKAAAVFERAIVVRETLYCVSTAVAERRTPAAADLAVLHTVYMDTMAQSQLVPATEGYQWRWPEGTDALDSMLWPIVCSAVELLTSPEVQRVKICPGLGDCGWLFLDTSKSGRRRWCSMESCGSRAKMRRYYARTRARSEK